MRWKSPLLVAGLVAGISATALAQSSAPWAGRYRGQFDGGNGDVTIAGPAANGSNYKVDISVGGGASGCGGSVGGVGTATGKVLTLEVPTDNGLCTVTLTRTAGGLSVDESGCAYMHGASCGFSGSVRPLGGASSAMGPAWVVTAGGESYVRDAGGLSLVLEVGCGVEDGEPFVAIGIPNGPSIETSGQLTGNTTFARRFRGFKGAKVRALDGQGKLIGTATITVQRAPDGSGVAWLGGSLSEATFAAVKRSASIEVVSSHWTATFSGKGATAAIRRGSCQR
jgi:hypothetical protein